jgi:lipid II:glycine glycyltransferase (peptidoglycan interpeptide bridge formation enzyme)
MKNNLLNFIQSNSPDGGFLQSQYWRKFQESVGRKTYNVSADGENGELVAWASIIEHTLPVVGRYFYVPRGPIAHNMEHITWNKTYNEFLSKLIVLAKKNNAGWIRIEPAGEDILEFLRSGLKNIKIRKSAVDMQPRETLVVDISGGEEDLLARMKQKTRYNIRLAEKRGVHVTCNTKHVTPKNIDQFLKLVKITAKRDRITAHPENYYRKMFGVIPPEILKLYVAEYEGKIIAANLVLFFGKTATYMHGASDNVHRDAMAPHLLQWRQIQDAKKAGCTMYDLGGVQSCDTKHVIYNKSWEGITRFKTGFAPDMESIKFPGCYDIILKPGKYRLYRLLQKVKRIF